MAKNRLSKSEERRLKAKAGRAHAVETAERIRLIAETITSNSILRAMLLQEPDVDRRRQLFEFMKPHLRFANPEFPSTIESPRILLM